MKTKTVLSSNYHYHTVIHVFIYFNLNDFSLCLVYRGNKSGHGPNKNGSGWVHLNSKANDL